MKKKLLSVMLMLAMIVPLLPAPQPVAAASKYVEIKIVDKAHDPLSGYYVGYTVNGVYYRSDQAGEKMNQNAWKFMSDEDKMTTITTFGWNKAARFEQFGYTSNQMVDWYNEHTGWTALSAKYREMTIEREYPTFYAR